MKNEDQEVAWNFRKEIAQQTESMVLTMLIMQLEKLIPGFSRNSLQNSCLAMCDDMRANSVETPEIADLVHRIRQEAILEVISGESPSEPPPPPRQ